MSRKDSVIEAALALARSYDFEEEHSRQVTTIALMLFDGLKRVHGLGERERLLVEMGDLLAKVSKAKADIDLSSEDITFLKERASVTLAPLAVWALVKGLGE